MKPITKRQKEVAALLKKLPPISQKQKEWAKEHCFTPKGYKLKDEIWCNCCGRVFTEKIPELCISLEVGNKHVCPHCGKKLKIENCRAKKKQERGLMTIVTTCGGWQVLRHVEVYKWLYKLSQGINADSIRYSSCEIVQEWINDRGEREVVARAILMSNCVGTYNWTSELSLKRQTYENRYYHDIEGDVYPIKKVLPILNRNGYRNISKRNSRLCDIFTHLLTDSKFETMMKAGQVKLADYCIGRYITDIWSSAKIAIRNHYQVKEPALWVDMIKAMAELGGDIRNRKFVCPKDLRAEHDKWIKALYRKHERERREAEQRRAEQEAERARGWEMQYQQEKAAYIGMVIEGEGIIITAIPTVEAMREEGKAMHHCVFTNGYYKKPDSLILSARDEQGKRLETIEVNLTVLKIAQCYGACNQLTERHQEIIDLMEANMGEIARRRNQRIEQEYGCAI